VDPFSYLSVLLSIILGLGITHLLAAASRLIRGRAMVRFYWPPLLWAAVMLVIYVQVWWSLFGLRGRSDWSFLSFSIILMQTVLLYMATSLVLPEAVVDEPASPLHATMVPDVSAGNDLRAYYDRQVGWFFTLLGATVVVSALKEVGLEGRLPTGWNLVFHLFLLVVCALAIAIRSPRLHQALAVINASAVLVYIGALFSRLR
jgi:hypothetical protein